MSPKSTGDPRDRISDGIRVRAPAIQRAAKPHGVVGDLKIRTMAPVDGPIPEIWTMILLGNMRRVSDLAANANTVLDGDQRHVRKILRADLGRLAVHGRARHRQ